MTATLLFYIPQKYYSAKAAGCSLSQDIR